MVISGRGAEPRLGVAGRPEDVDDVGNGEGTDESEGYRIREGT